MEFTQVSDRGPHIIFEFSKRGANFRVRSFERGAHKKTAAILLLQLKKRKEKYNQFNLEIVNNKQRCCKTQFLQRKSAIPH